MIIIILINILCYWVYYTIRSNSYTKKYNYDSGHYDKKKCPLPLWEAILIGLFIIIPGGCIAIAFWLGMSTCAIYEVTEIRLSDKHILKRIYKFITKDLAK
jgi:hypothetical protein